MMDAQIGSAQGIGMGLLVRGRGFILSETSDSHWA